MRNLAACCSYLHPYPLQTIAGAIQNSQERDPRVHQHPYPNIVGEGRAGECARQGSLQILFPLLVLPVRNTSPRPLRDPPLRRGLFHLLQPIEHPLLQHLLNRDFAPPDLAGYFNILPFPLLLIDQRLVKALK